MHSATPRNAIANTNNNDGIRHQKDYYIYASDPLADDDVNLHRVQPQYVLPIRNRQFSSVANNSNGRSAYEQWIMAEASKIQGHLASLQVGYRFCPTDQELIGHYLLKKIKNESLCRNKIGDVDIYTDHPKKIVANWAQAKEGQWFFFSPRSRKYVNGSRPARKAGCGYWKATGPDKKIKDAKGVIIGSKKSLVYYKSGKPPTGKKTSWIMQEYVVAGHQRQRLDKHDMKLDDYVLCKIYKKEKGGGKVKKDSSATVPSIPEEQAQHPSRVVHMVAHTSYCHPTMVLQQDLAVPSQQVPPPLYLPPPPPPPVNLEFFSQENYLIVPPESYPLDTNWSAPSYASAAACEIGDGQGFSDDDLYKLGFYQLNSQPSEG